MMLSNRNDTPTRKRSTPSAATSRADVPLLLCKEHASLVASALVVVGTLVVERDTVLLHLRLGAGTTRKISVTTDRSEGSGASGEVVVGDGLETMAVVRTTAVARVAVARGVMRRT